MKIETIKRGRYVVAVSGGVDSMVLLDLLVAQARRRQGRARQGNEPILGLVVAHFDHGIRPDSAKDRRLVQRVAQAYDLPFEYQNGKLGVAASEATARAARYAFLEEIRVKHRARAIITAHHRDDMLETAILNLLRGTGRKGLSSLRSNQERLRPLLGYTKKEIRAYADQHHLHWREDSTNADERYLRNYIRRVLLPRFGEGGQKELLERIDRAAQTSDEIDRLLAEDLEKQVANQLNRAWYLQLPFTVAKEIMAAWLRKNGIIQFDRALIEHLVVAAKTAKPGKLADIDARYIVEFTKDAIKLASRQARPQEETLSNDPTQL